MPPGAGSVPSARKIFFCSGSARVALRDMQGAAILAPEGRGDPLLAIEDGSQAGPAGAFSLLAEASADCLHHLVGDHGDEQMAVGAPLGAVEDGAQSEFRLERAEHGLDIGEAKCRSATAPPGPSPGRWCAGSRRRDG